MKATSTRRAARPSTAPSTDTNDTAAAQAGAAGVGAPTVPLATNTRESITTARGDHTPVEGESCPPTITHPTSALVRSILATLAPDTAAALVALLVAWLRAVTAALVLPLDTARDVAERAADAAVNDAVQLGARAHMGALVGALLCDTPHGIASTIDAPELRAHTLDAVRDALGALLAIDGAPSAVSLVLPPLAGPGGAAVLRGVLGAELPPAPRARLSRALAAFARDEGASDAALVALHLSALDGTDPERTATLAMSAVGAVAKHLRRAARTGSRASRPQVGARAAAHTATLGAHVLEHAAATLGALDASPQASRDEALTDRGTVRVGPTRGRT